MCYSQIMVMVCNDVGWLVMLITVVKDVPTLILQMDIEFCKIPA